MLVPRRVPPKNAKLVGPSFIGHREAVDIFFRHGYYLCFKRQVTTPGFQQIQLLTSAAVLLLLMSAGQRWYSKTIVWWSGQTVIKSNSFQICWWRSICKMILEFLSNWVVKTYLKWNWSITCHRLKKWQPSKPSFWSVCYRPKVVGFHVAKCRPFAFGTTSTNLIHSIHTVCVLTSEGGHNLRIFLSNETPSGPVTLLTFSDKRLWSRLWDSFSAAPCVAHQKNPEFWQTSSLTVRMKHQTLLHSHVNYRESPTSPPFAAPAG